MFGVGSEIAAAMQELAFDYLDAPVGRLHTERVSFPFSPALDGAVAVTVDKIVVAARKVVSGVAPMQMRPGTDATGPGAWAPRPTTAAATPASGPAVVPPARPAPEPAALAVTAPVEGGVPVAMPNMDLTIAEATIVRWLKRVGDTVRLGEPIVEVETDKAVLVVESTAGGTVVQLLAAEGAAIPLGQPLAMVKP